ncbi:MAG: DUF4982 domain-containing protein [Lachnospiraceae bacterium]|nr:DUF4982 domain-containing protein [Lachnospiraceae bacterium]
MRKIGFNEGFRYAHLGAEDWTPVRIPHDAMLEEPREYSPYGHNNGFFRGGDYIYRKEFDLPEQASGKYVCLEFEGVYHRSTVNLNGTDVVSEYNGYIGFYADVTDLVKARGNVLTVTVRNSDQPNSRWYTGSGIYRPVWLWYGDREKRIAMNGIRIRTLSLAPAEAEVRVRTVGNGPVTLRIADGGKTLFTCTTESSGEAVFRASLPGAEPWSAGNPRLYTAEVRFGDDEETVEFGLRTLELDKEKGFLVNGKRELLLGACMHADNGLLGMKEYEDAAMRKVRILKSAGYNAIRSAHHPVSKAMLAACDRLGMYIVDEYTDMWYIHKNKYDYAADVPERYEEDIRALVEKDYSHPSVVMYSSGNEVSETAEKRGVEFTGTLTDVFHRLDDTRPVTCGINIFFNFLASLKVGYYSDEKAEAAAEDPGKQAEPQPVKASAEPGKAKKPAKAEEAKAPGKPKKQKAVGSEFFNNLAGTFGSDTMKVLSWFPFCDWATKKAFAKMDVAGYNYANPRYKKDHRKYPDRFILGAETFITDAYSFLKTAESRPRILGDFAWAGMDYIGEVALGSLDYPDYAEDFDKNEKWLTAGTGCFDITGQAQGHTAYVQVVYGKRDIAIAVQPADHSGEGHMTAAWRKIHAFESWSWNGCDGHKVLVEVFSRTPVVKLFINGKCVGTKKRGDCRFRFRTVYEPGEIVAVGLDKDGKECCRTALHTAGEETKLSLEPEQAAVKKDGLLYVRLRYTDPEGTGKPLARGDIHIETEGGTLLGLGSACPYNPRGYLTDTTDTYYGEALAVIRAEAPEVTVRGESPFGKASVTVKTV